MSLDTHQTTRLLFERISEKDAEFILTLMNEAGYLEFIGDRGLRTPDDARDYIARKLDYTEEGLGFYKVLLRENGQPIGIVGVVKREFLADPDVGYALLRDFEGRGFAIEAAAEAYRWGKEELGFEKICAIVSPGNTASIRVLEKLDLLYAGEAAFPGEEEPVLLFDG
jgi:RimJ/RimL family protein N-acetyltransferase